MTRIIGEPDGATLLDPDEMEGLKFKAIKTRGQLNQLEQINIVEGSQWLSKKKNVDVLSDVFLKEYHKKLFGKVWSWAGKYRLTEKNIGVNPFSISVDVFNLIEDTKVWVDNSTFEPIELAAKFHHRLVKIHPFPNGNGRHARHMANALLKTKFNLGPINWSGNLDGSSDSRTAYIKALRAADTGDFKLLLEYVGAIKD